jgi:hypothetical protein
MKITIVEIILAFKIVKSQVQKLGVFWDGSQGREMKITIVEIILAFKIVKSQVQKLGVFWCCHG